MGLKYNWNYPQYDETFLNDLKEYNISESNIFLMIMRKVMILF